MLGRLPFVLLMGLATGLANGETKKASNTASTLRGLLPVKRNARKLQELMCPGKKIVPSPTSTAMVTSTTATPKATTTSPPVPVTTFCVVADAPYRYEENLKLTKQVDEMDPECEFVAHLGDIRSARQFDTCVKETYTNASRIMRRSKKPVLMMLGGKFGLMERKHSLARHSSHTSIHAFSQIMNGTIARTTSKPCNSGMTSSITSLMSTGITISILPLNLVVSRTCISCINKLYSLLSTLSGKCHVDYVSHGLRAHLVLSNELISMLFHLRYDTQRPSCESIGVGRSFDQEFQVDQATH